MEPLGALPLSDPLHALITGALGLDRDSHLDVFALNNPDGAVYLYTDAATGQRAVAKFYGRKWINDSRTGEPELRGILLRREVEHLQYLRDAGFTGSPYFVPRPLAWSDEIDWVLLEDYVEGVNLHHAIWDCVANGNCDVLYRSIGHTARFLRELHRKDLSPLLGEGRQPYAYHLKLLRQLRERGLLDEEEVVRHQAAAREWVWRGVDENLLGVPIHGDATPEHFLWSESLQRLGVIDFESLRNGDPAEDLGYLAAEMKHLFWSYSGDRWASEPFIVHLYRSYGAYYPLTQTARFFMACAELRIARNFWLPFDYRRQLIAEAEQCLKG